MNMGHIMASMLERNPQMANNPRAKEMIDVIKSGDKIKGQQIADNLCRTYGVTRDEAINMATNYFNLH